MISILFHTQKIHAHNSDRRPTTLTECSSLNFTGHFTQDFFFHGATTPTGPGPSHCSGFKNTHGHTILVNTPLEKWSARRRDLYLTTHNTPKKKDIRDSGGIRTRNPRKREAADPQLRPRGHRGNYKRQVKQTLYRPVTDAEGSKRLRFPDFEQIGTWRWKGCQP